MQGRLRRPDELQVACWWHATRVASATIFVTQLPHQQCTPALLILSLHPSHVYIYTTLQSLHIQHISLPVTWLHGCIVGFWGGGS
jgi:hypothetical protein